MALPESRDVARFRLRIEETPMKGYR